QVVRLTRTLDRAQSEVATRSLQRTSSEVLAQVEAPRSTVEPRTRTARLHVLRDTRGSLRHEPRNVVCLLEVVSAGEQPGSGRRYVHQRHRPILEVELREAMPTAAGDGREDNDDGCNADDA